MDQDIEQIVAEMKQKAAMRAAGNAEAFVESEYLDLYPDVRGAIAAGTYQSGYDHWVRTGQAEGRRLRKNLWRSGAAIANVRSHVVPPLPIGEIGQPTPWVGTVRGRLSHAFMRLMSKVLWWYSYRLQQVLAGLTQPFNDLQNVQAAAFESLEEEIRTIETRVDGMLERLSARQEEVRKVSFQAGARLEALQQGLRETAARHDELHAAVEKVRQETAQKPALETARTARFVALEARLADVAKVAHDNGVTHIPNLANRIAAVGLYANQIRAELTVQERRISLLLEQARGLPQEGVAESGRVAATPSNHDAALYLNFEGAFRGTREEITERQKVYLPMLRAAGAGQHDRPVLDLGCGRGEWLELLRAEEMEAAGVDNNESMLETCRGLGLRVTSGDAIGHLRGLADGSLGAVTAFHLVEHLPFEVLMTLVDESIRVLKHDGILILETPNPGNMLVAAQYFYLDPTHNRPLPSPMLRFFVEARGMRRVEVLELHPYPETMRVPEDGSELAKRFNDYFYGPRDYAVIALRP